jgi:RimJ/RimL family protein N-acetyltransferase
MYGMIRNWNKDDSKNAGEHEHFARNVERWIAQELTREELCFVWVENLEIKGGIAFLVEGAEALVLDFSLSHDSFHLGTELLKQSIERLLISNVCYHLYNDSDEFEQYKQCFLDCGFLVTQEKLSYHFTKGTVDCSTSHMDFRSYAEVGEEEFLKAISAVGRHTLDRGDAKDYAKYGQDEGAKEHLRLLKELESDFQPSTWVLAYEHDRLIGLVIPTNFGDSRGGINYIGVVPEERGKGYVDHLLNKGTSLLLEQGVTTVIADIDVLNFPIKDALERNGYEFHQEEVVLEFL